MKSFLVVSVRELEARVFTKQHQMCLLFTGWVGMKCESLRGQALSPRVSTICLPNVTSNLLGLFPTVFTASNQNLAVRMAWEREWPGNEANARPHQLLLSWHVSLLDLNLH